MTQARRFLEQSHKRALSEHDAESIAKARHGIAYLDAAAGQWDAARNLYRQNEALCREAGIDELRALSFNGLGIACLVEKDWTGALSLLDEGIAVCAAHEVNGAGAFLLANRGLALVQLGRAGDARASIDKAIAVAEQWNIKIASVESHLARCHLALAEAEAALALNHLQRAMAVAAQIQSPLRILSVARYWGDWLIQGGERLRGLAVLECVRSHGATLHKDRSLAAEAIAAQVADARSLGAARKLAAALTPAGMAEEILAHAPSSMVPRLALTAV
jgi:tetratricopeptide (TPR) repeat protein